MMKYVMSVILVAGLLTGIGSASFLTEPTEMNRPGWPGFPISFMESLIPSFGDMKVYNLYDEFYPPKDVTVPENETSALKPELTLPKPLPITKDELYQSIITISPQKQSVLQKISSKPIY
jgi:hypothetical protein